MPSKDKITREVYEHCKRMLLRLLLDSDRLGVGYVLQLVYELAIVIIAYESGSEYAYDKYIREAISSYRHLIVARNTINHNSYDIRKVTTDVMQIVHLRVVEQVYLYIFGEAPGYSLFETECYVYLEYMKRLWAD